MLACSSKCFNCSQCDYTTTRKYNYERHMNIVHKTSLIDIPQNVALTSQNVAHEEEHKCPTCYKQFTSKYNLKRHEPVCKNIIQPNQCKECLKIFSSRTSLYHHKSHCKGLQLIVPSGESQNAQQISIQNAQTIQNNINNTTNNINNTINLNILPCPTTRDPNFNFNCEDITYDVLMKILNLTNDSNVRFNTFVKKILENPQNQVIKKTNPKDTYSMIHTGDGNWELAHDKDTFPAITHHMTTAAIGKTIELDKEQKNNFLKSFQEQVRVFNELDYESSDYKDIIMRIKIHVINITKDVMKEVERLQV